MLWYVAAPADAYAGTSADTATAYNAAGQVVAVIHLGTEASGRWTADFMIVKGF